jgi:hypothetical protein
MGRGIPEDIQRAESAATRQPPVERLSDLDRSQLPSVAQAQEWQRAPQPEREAARAAEQAKRAPGPWERRESTAANENTRAGGPENAPGASSKQPGDLTPIAGKIRTAWEKLMGTDPKWNRINKSLQVVFLALAIPMYFLGSSFLSVRIAVYYIWRTGLFGMWSDDIPYTCYNFVGDLRLCPQSFLQTDHYLDPSIALLGYVIDGAISLRIITFCLERLAAGLGGNLLSGIIDRVLPKRKDPQYQQYFGEVHVGDKVNVGSAQVVMSRSTARDITTHAEASNLGDLTAIANELASLRKVLRKENSGEEPERDAAIGAVALAEKAARAGDRNKMLDHLKSAGTWASDVATKIGVNLASAALKSAIGLCPPNRDVTICAI